MTPKEEKDYERMYLMLLRIKQYQSPSKMRRDSQKDWGVGFEECLEMAYENIQQEAARGLKGVRRPKGLAR